jgi:hypothetical protein
MEYVEVNDDDTEMGEEEEENVPDSEEEMPPAVKIGPPRGRKRKPPHTEDSVQVAGPSTVPEDSLLLSPAPIPGPSTLPLPQVSPKKKTSKNTQSHKIARPNARPATRSSSNPNPTKMKVKTNEAPALAQNDQGKKSSRRHGQTELVDKVSKLFKLW